MYIGKYGTKEKAIKVLDMIQNAYQETMKYQNCEGQVTRIKDIPNKFFPDAVRLGEIIWMQFTSL